MITISYKYEQKFIEGKPEIKECTFVMLKEGDELDIIEGFYRRIWLLKLKTLIEFTVKENEKEAKTFNLLNDNGEENEEPFAKLYRWVVLDRLRVDLEDEYIVAKTEYFRCLKNNLNK